jgi:hypothetical protein
VGVEAVDHGGGQVAGAGEINAEGDVVGAGMVEFDTSLAVGIVGGDQVGVGLDQSLVDDGGLCGAGEGESN